MHKNFPCFGWKHHVNSPSRFLSILGFFFKIILNNRACSFMMRSSYENQMQPGNKKTNWIYWIFLSPISYWKFRPTLISHFDLANVATLGCLNRLHLHLVLLVPQKWHISPLNNTWFCVTNTLQSPHMTARWSPVVASSAGGSECTANRWTQGWVEWEDVESSGCPKRIVIPTHTATMQSRVPLDTGLVPSFTVLSRTETSKLNQNRVWFGL